MAIKYSVTKEIFSKRLKELMSDNNETTYSLGEILNLSAATISRYTDGKMAPKITTIYSMATHFNVNPVWLMGYDVEKILEAQNNKFELSKEETTLLESYNKSNNEGKKMILSYSDYVSKNYIDNATCEVTTTKEEDNKVVELPKKEKQVWEEEGKEYLMPIACHDDNLTEEELAIVNEKINEILNNLDKY